MTTSDKKAVTSEVDSTRRSLALSILGTLGGAAVLGGCASEGKAEGTDEVLKSTQAALTGIQNIYWVDRMAGTEAAARL